MTSGVLHAGFPGLRRLRMSNGELNILSCMHTH